MGSLVSFWPNVGSVWMRPQQGADWDGYRKRTPHVEGDMQTEPQTMVCKTKRPDHLLSGQRAQLDVTILPIRRGRTFESNGNSVQACASLCMPRDRFPWHACQICSPIVQEEAWVSVRCSI